MLNLLKVTSFVFLQGLLSFQSYAACNKQEHPISDIATYYAPVAGLAGEQLHQGLNAIIRDHKKYSYTPCVWAILKQADQDPQNHNNVIGIYTRRSIPKSRQDSGRNDPDSWNREHIWAKSHGFSNKRQHAYTDAHHLRAADRTVNSDRSDNDFANGGSADDECNGCFEGQGTWEPPNRVKGDVARMMFYLAVRYDGNDNSNTPDLVLVNRDTERVPEFGRLCTLLQWHIDDPVVPAEVTRNNVIESWQGNRNPFIDHPEFTVSIWGEQCNIDSVNDDFKQQVLDQIKKIQLELDRLKELIN